MRLSGLFLAFFMCVFSNVVFASHTVPAACPTVEALQHIGFLSVLEERYYQVYAVFQIAKYNTPETWGFVVAVPFDEVASKQDAMNKAKESLLKGMSMVPVPVSSDEATKQWYCLYNNEYGYFTVAFTPLMAAPVVRDVLKANHTALPATLRARS